MGEIADMMLEGTLCVGCGEYMIDAGYGVPRYCAGCDDGLQLRESKVKCKTCGRKVKAVGLQQHMRDAHGK